MRAIDVAPTLAFLMRIPGPQNARGKILKGAVERGVHLREITIINISDYHGQLIPLTETADNVTGTGALNPVFNIGGAAFLKPWFEEYRDEAQNGSITGAGGDSFGGATPPISNEFGDLPTVELMNEMDFDLEAVGNHSFDRGEQYLRNVLIPEADFHYHFFQRRLPQRADADPNGRLRGRSTSAASSSASSGSRPRTRRTSSSRGGSARSY